MCSPISRPKNSIDASRSSTEEVLPRHGASKQNLSPEIQVVLHPCSLNSKAPQRPALFCSAKTLRKTVSVSGDGKQTLRQ
jgi:hypothetical protein